MLLNQSSGDFASDLNTMAFISSGISGRHDRQIDHNLRQQRLQRHPRERRVPRQHVVENHAQRVDVDARVNRLRIGNLLGHEFGRPHGQPAARLEPASVADMNFEVGALLDVVGVPLALGEEDVG